MKPTQLPLELRAEGGPQLDQFQPADAPALAAVRALIDQPDGAPLLLIGAGGSGKTHLLLAAVAALQAQPVEAAYLPLRLHAEQAVALVEAQPACAALAIDDLQQAEHDPDLQRALFALHNRQRDAGGRLLYASRNAPNDWDGALPDLRSRLNACTRLVLEPLGEAGRREWLTLRARERGFALEPAAVEFLFRRCGRDFARLNQLLDRLDQASLSEQRRLTVPFLRQLLRDAG